jgi:preprotein translocase subunit SecE
MKFINYIRETKGELKHVSWPTRKQAVTYTILVVIISIVTAAYLGVFDWVFKGVVEKTF